MLIERFRNIDPLPVNIISITARKAFTLSFADAPLIEELPMDLTLYVLAPI